MTHNAYFAGLQANLWNQQVLSDSLQTLLSAIRIKFPENTRNLLPGVTVKAVWGDLQRNLRRNL